MKEEEEKERLKFTHENLIFIKNIYHLFQRANKYKGNKWLMNKVTIYIVIWVKIYFEDAYVINIIGWLIREKVVEFTRIPFRRF